MSQPCRWNNMNAAAMQYQEGVGPVSGVTAAHWRPCGTTDTEAPRRPCRLDKAGPPRQGRATSASHATSTCDIVVRCTTMSYAGAQAKYRASGSTSGVIYVTLILRKICAGSAIYGTMML